MEQDKRGYARYNVFMSPFYCSKCDSEDINVDINDVSCSGIGISINEKISRGDKIELKLIIPEDDIPMFISGEITWVTRHPDMDDYFNAGVRLININHCDRERLIKYINRVSYK